MPRRTLWRIDPWKGEILIVHTSVIGYNILYEKMNQEEKRNMKIAVATRMERFSSILEKQNLSKYMKWRIRR